jgi:hypothetical protein
MQFWVEKTYVKSRPDRQKGEFAFGSVLWSPQSGSELEAFSKATRPVAKLYEEIVGRQTELPLNLEVDQFFSWLFENNESETPKKPVKKCQY